MDINPFLTTTASSSVQKTAGGKPAPVSIQGLAFIDLILTRLAEISKQGPEVKKDGEEKAFDAAQLLAVSDDVKQDVKDMQQAGILNGDAQAEIMNTLALNQQALDDTITPLTDGVITTKEIQNGSPRLLNTLMLDTEKDRKAVLDKLSMILNKLEKLTQAKDGTGLALTNLTPEQVTNLKAKIEALLAANAQNADSEDAELAGIMLGLIKILPPQAQPEIIVMPGSLVITPRPMDVKVIAAQNTKLKAANDLASTLNNLVVGGDGAEESTGIFSETGEEDFGDLLKQFSGKKNGSGPELVLKTAGGAEINPSVKPDLSVLQNWVFPDSGSLITTADDWRDYFDGMRGPGLNITGSASLTNLSAHAPSATSAHPAVQMVAATIQKAASDGTRNISLQLDPPELGKIEVRMNFGKDKTVKAVVFTENRETFNMLQRDSHVLERALLAAGIDADGSSLSFELAADGHFDGNDGGSGGNSQGRHGAAGGEEQQIIESNMTWYVDATTGHMRYDILA